MIFYRSLRLLPLVLGLCLLAAGGLYVKTHFLDLPAGARSPYLPPLSESLPDNGGVPDQGGRIPAVVGASPGGPLDLLASLPNFAVEDPANARARREALSRANAVPNLDAAQRAKVIAAVNGARSVGCIFIVPFESGRHALLPREASVLVDGFQAANLRRLREDRTLIFAVLGYTDKQEDIAAAEKASTERAENVLAIMRGRCGVQDVSYAVGMGGTDRFDTRVPSRNRLVEIWAGYPGQP